MSDTETTTAKKPRPRKTSRHPLLVDRPSDVWHADLVGKVPGYPATAGGFANRQAAARKQAHAMNANGQRGTRKGVPDGWAGRRNEVELLRAEAAERGRIATAKLIALGCMDESADARDEARAKLATEVCAAFITDPTNATNDRMRAARLLLKYCHPISCPTGGRVTPDTAAEFLNALAAGSVTGAERRPGAS